jgi:hypothetical protein
MVDGNGIYVGIVIVCPIHGRAMSVMDGYVRYAPVRHHGHVQYACAVCTMVGGLLRVPWSVHIRARTWLVAVYVRCVVVHGGNG